MVKRRAWWGLLFAEPSPLGVLRYQVRTGLPPGQARVVLGLVAIPDDPASYALVAEAFGIHIGTVHTHLRRVREREPALYRRIMAERRRQLEARHQAILEERRQRSLQWGRRRYAAAYRQAHGRWPWEVMRDG